MSATNTQTLSTDRRTRLSCHEGEACWERILGMRYKDGEELMIQWRYHSKCSVDVHHLCWSKKTQLVVTSGSAAKNGESPITVRLLECLLTITIHSFQHYSYVTANYTYVNYVMFRYPYRVFQSCLFQQCDLVPRFPVPRFPFPRFQSLHQATEFRPNRSSHCENMTSYLFLKMAAATAEYYFRFRICWCHCFQKAKVY